jgi:hypothetical protein
MLFQSRWVCDFIISVIYFLGRQFRSKSVLGDTYWYICGSLPLFHRMDVICLIFIKFLVQNNYIPKIVLPLRR